ncbi:lipocalin family protein [Flavobacterium ardleyense]|uniref:lipocalin family protein n=1 Tax=Flavobacterium ardleyense TaxID=2038737 RepID=UPI00298D07AA|nr:lipocalin family protein [Flavobacterium ardleyense]
MKSFKILIATVVLSAFTLTSCSSDDDNVQVPTSIVGKWNYSMDVTQTNVGTSVGPEIIVEYTGDEPGCNRDFLEFNANMSVRKGVYNKNVQNVCTEDAISGTYTKTGDQITINLPVTGEDMEEYNGTFKITKLNSSQLSLEKKFVDGEVTVIRTRLLTKSI